MTQTDETINDIDAPEGTFITEDQDAAEQFLALPAPPPEGQKYIGSLGLGRNGIEKIPYASDKVAAPDKKDAVFFKIDPLLRFESSEDGDTDLAFYQQIASVRGRDGRDLTSFRPKGGTVNGIQYIGSLVGVSRGDFESGGAGDKEYLTALERTLRTRPGPKVLVNKLQWQWSMKLTDVVNAATGKPINYKTVAYGMAKANKREDGTIDPVLYFTPQGVPAAKGDVGAVAVTAKAVVLELAKIN